MSKKQNGKSIYEKKSKAIKQRAKRRARFMGFLLISVICVSLVCAYVFVLKPSRQYELAKAEMENGNWQAANDGFKQLGSFKDSSSLAAVSECLAAFESKDVSVAANKYLALNASQQDAVKQGLGSFEILEQTAMDMGEYESAYLYYSLDLDNPERDDAMYAINVYLDSKELLDDNRYSEAREEINACLSVSHTMSDQLQNLVDLSYKSEFEYYDSYTYTDLAYAVSGMESIRDEYEPAHIYLRDLKLAYDGGIAIMRDGKYSEAIRLLEDISAYLDSEEKIIECRLLLANQQANNGDSVAALETLNLIGDWQSHMDYLPADNSLGALLYAANDALEDADEANA